jgi:hypothetical protein
MIRSSFIPSAPYARKAIASLVGLGLAGIVVSGVLVFTVANSFMETRRTLAESRRLIERSTVGVTGVSRGVATPTAKAALARALLSGVDPAELQSQLQTLVKDVAGRHAVIIDSLQVLKTERVGGLNRMSLRLDGSLPQANLGAFLADLATGEPVILFQGLELRPQVLQANRLTLATSGGGMIAARVELAAYGGVPMKGTADRRGAKP